MTVEYDEKLLNNDAITKAVIDAGYGAKVSNPETQKNNKNQLCTLFHLKFTLR